MSDIKTFCYKSDCEIIVTGAVQSTWYVCRTCKEEITPALHKKIQDNTDTKNNDNTASDDEDMYPYWFTKP